MYIYVYWWYMYHGAYFGVSNNSVNSNVTLSSWQLLCLFISHINKIRSLYAYCVDFYIQIKIELYICMYMVLKYIFFKRCKISNEMKVYTDETMYMKSLFKCSIACTSWYAGTLLARQNWLNNFKCTIFLSHCLRVTPIKHRICVHSTPSNI